MQKKIKVKTEIFLDFLRQYEPNAIQLESDFDASFETEYAIDLGAEPVAQGSSVSSLIQPWQQIDQRSQESTIIF